MELRAPDWPVVKDFFFQMLLRKHRSKNLTKLDSVTGNDRTSRFVQNITSLHCLQRPGLSGDVLEVAKVVQQRSS